jgi:hypothetical protein
VAGSQPYCPCFFSTNGFNQKNVPEL